MRSLNGLDAFLRGPGAARRVAPPRADLRSRAPRDGVERDAGTRVQIIVTPGSGEGRALSTARMVHRALSAAGYGTALQTFDDMDRLLRWAEACEPSFAHLVCVGGDGTQSAAARAALRLAVPLVPVPTGFGNMFARAFGHRATPDAVIALMRRGEICAIDVGRAADDLFLSHRSYGPLQEIEASVERGRDQLRPRALRTLAYYALGGRYLVGTPLPSIRVEIDGALVSEDAVMVTVANVETYRGFLSLTPAAVPTDGLLDVFVMPRSTRVQFWKRLLKLWLRAPGRWDGIALRRGRRVRISVNQGPADDLRIVPAALRVLVPAGSITRLATRERARRLTPPGPAVVRHLSQPSGPARTPAGRSRALPPARASRSRARRPGGRAARG